MKQLTVIALLILLAACEPAKQDKADEGSIRLKDSAVVVGGGPRNSLKYAQTENPHRQINKVFLFKELKGQFEIRNTEVSAVNCLRGNAGVTFFLMTADKLSKVEGEQTFSVVPGDEFQVVVDNAAECKGISVTFEIAAIP